ncbi:MAG TPA: hypothetical protein VGK67_06695 [Myxococcales bacterium]|jgi:hypothetical protein
MSPLRAAASALALAALLLPSAALAQAAVGATPGTEMAQAAPPPKWAMYNDPVTGTYVKPILGLSGGFNLEMPRNRRADGTAEPLENNVTALALAIFGVEGRLRDWATVHLEFRRDAGNYGTSVWEGTVSFTALDNYLRLEHWGFKLAGGIVSDPASSDFFSVHMTDLFMADALSRTPLLVGGYNRGQGVLLQYGWRWFTAGMFASAGNPLATTLSYGFGGDVSPLGTIIQVPSKGMEAGNPVPGYEFDALSPSLTIDSQYVEARLAYQFHSVNTNTRKNDDVRLTGDLFRAGVKGRIWGGRIQPYANVAWRKNQMVDQTTKNPTFLDGQSYRAMVVSGGLDLNLLGASGIGANYAYVRSKQGGLDLYEQHYINVGATYWIIDNISVGLRYAKLMTFTAGNVADGIPDKDSFYLVLRVVI